MDNSQRAGAITPPDKPGLRLSAKKKLGLIDPLRLVGYRGYGTSDYLMVRGRVLEDDRRENGAESDAGTLTKAWRTLRELTSDEMPGARLWVYCDGKRYPLFTDAEGFFQVSIPAKSSNGWRQIDVEVADSIAGQAPHRGSVDIMTPDPRSEFGVISDIDDTIIKSHATNKFEMMRLTLTEDAADRTPFPHIADVLRSLQTGGEGRPENPIFYVSRSGWNVYEIFIEFFESRGIPRGPLFLRDLAFREKKSTALGSEFHKLARIRELLRAYPRLPFLLIGDSGQSDANTYLRIALEFPGRIKGIYLRDIGDGDKRREANAILNDLRRIGVPGAVASDSREFLNDLSKQAGG